MNCLDKFLEPIKVAGNSIGNKYKAYKMDNTDAGKDMRKVVGLGECHCCDYFLPKDKSITLIEETRLLEKMKNIKKKYDYLNDKDKDKVANNRIRERMQLKAYGAMLVLCRLTAKCTEVKQLFQDKKYNFWLVASNIKSEDDKIFFDNLKDDLRQRLKQVLGKTLLDDVDVLSSDTLQDRLSGK